jgi:hypothetical protein
MYKTLFTIAQSQLVGHERDPPLCIEDGRPMALLVQHRRVRGEGRIFGEWHGLDRSHSPTLPTRPNTANVQGRDGVIAIANPLGMPRRVGYETDASRTEWS